MRQYIETDKSEEEYLISNLKGNEDVDSIRVLKAYDLPDLTRTDGNPIQMIVEKIKSMEFYKDFDLIETPEVVGVYETFDLFEFAQDHVARSKSDTYYVANDKILRPHTTVMWHYYFNSDGIKDKLEKEGEIKVLSHGKVYRKDEIDRNHYPVFHQIDGLYICKKEDNLLDEKDLENVLVDMAKAIYGDDIKYKVSPDTFPYTYPSLEMEIYFRDEWLEILGAGVVSPKVLENLGVDSSKYNGWAFGPGVERLAMVKMNIPDIRIFWSDDERILNQWGDLEREYKAVSKYPSTYRDVSFIVDKAMSLNNYYELVRDIAGDLVEEVTTLDTYENDEKFGSDKISYTFRIVYRSHSRTLENEEINEIQTGIRQQTEIQLGASLR